MHEQHSQPLFGEICHDRGGRCCCADNCSRERWCRKSFWSGFITVLLCLCFEPSWWGRVLWGPEVRTSISSTPQALVWPPPLKKNKINETQTAFMPEVLIRANLSTREPYPSCHDEQHCWPTNFLLSSEFIGSQGLLLVAVDSLNLGWDSLNPARALH